MSHDGLLHHILNLFHGGAAAQLLAGDLNALGDPLDLKFGHSCLLGGGFIGLGYSNYDFLDIKYNLGTVSFDDLHIGSSLSSFRFSFIRAGLLYNILWFCQDPYTRYRDKVT